MAADESTPVPGTEETPPEAPALKARCLTRLDAATRPQDMNVPGFDFHPLKGKPKRY